MANEGSTKPTYSELEAELLRVRGLLQHYGVHKADCGTWDVTYGDRENKELMAKACDCGLTAELSTFPQSSSLVSQGAESADIGKLDTADKSGIDEQFKGMATDEQYQAETLKIEKEFAHSDWEALQRSAETGGEKAAPEKCGRFADPPNLDDCTFHIHLKKRVCDDEEGTAYVAHILELDIVAVDPEPWRALEKLSLLVNRQINFGLRNSRGASIWFPAPKKYFDEAGATFPRTSQNQTVSSGVEGAHEGTTADKTGSREPEKLNNAQKMVMSVIPIPTDAASVNNRREPGRDILNTLLFAYDDLHAKVMKDKGYAGCFLSEFCPHCLLVKQAKEALAESSLSQNADSSAPTIPTPLSTQPDTTKEKV